MRHTESNQKALSGPKGPQASQKEEGDYCFLGQSSGYLIVCVSQHLPRQVLLLRLRFSAATPSLSFSSPGLQLPL